MTREMAKQKLFELLEKGIVYFDNKGLIDNIYDDFEKELEELNKDCTKCKHYLSENGNFPLEPCGECSLWYSSQWECKE